MATVILFTGMSTFGLAEGAGVYVGFLDIAPSFAGILLGISNCVAALVGFLPPYLVGVLTQNVSNGNVFFLESLMKIMVDVQTCYNASINLTCG